MAVTYPSSLASLDDAYSFTESIFTTSSSSTVWGPGALAGKALKLLGEKSLDLFCRVAIRRRLAFIRQTLEKSPHVLTKPSTAKEWQQRNAMYANLKELCRGPYPLSLRRAAANLLRDIVALITWSQGDHHVPKLSLDKTLGSSLLSIQPKLTSLLLTSFLSSPTHTQWVSLFHFIQRHEPLLLAEHGPFIIIEKRPPVDVEREFPHAVEGTGDNNGTSAPRSSTLSESQDVLVGRRAIEIVVTVEVQQSHGVQNDSTKTKIRTLGTRLFRSLRSEKPNEGHPGERRMTRVLRHHLKVLVLGAGGVGKSTLVMQQRRTFRNDSDPGWYSAAFVRETIIKNVIASMKSILLNLPTSALTHSTLAVQAKRSILNLPWSSHNVDSLSTEDVQAVGRTIITLWKEPSVRMVASKERASLLEDLFVAPESAAYFCDSASRIFSPDYAPTPEDALRSRIGVTYTTETALRSPTYTWHFYDPAGGRSERGKWNYILKDTRVHTGAIFFLIALSDYNRLLYEDASVNRIDDSLELFESIANSPLFKNTLIALILNKGDVFAEELEHTPLKDWMPDYEGETYADACKYIEKRFTDLIKDKTRPLRIHYTCAIDQKTMQEESIILRNEIVQHYEQQRPVAQQAW